MAWRGNYYYRPKRVNGRPRQVYVGRGLVARLAAQWDELDRERRKLRDIRAARELEDVGVHDEDVRLLERLADGLSQAALYAAGYWRHHRGPWRRKREPKGQ
jgi:hypothetical protein